MSGARSPVVVRQYSPNESSQLEALKTLLKTDSKKAAGCDQHRDGDDGTKIKGDSAYGRSIP